MMKHHSMKKMLLVIGCMVLIAAMALNITGCNSGASGDGEKKTFTVVVTDLEGKETTFTYTTDAKVLGEFLQAEGLIAGEEGPYGLYMNTVNGVTVDNKTYYWSFYVDGEYALAGIDKTDIQNGAKYELKPEKIG